MKRSRMLLVTLLLGSTQVGCFSRDAEVPIDWSASIPLGTERAAPGQPLLVYFTAPWCRICDRMDQESFSTAAVMNALERFVPVKINVDEQPKTADAYFAHAVPAYFVFDSAGEIRARATGFLNSEELSDYLVKSSDLLAAEQTSDD